MNAEQQRVAENKSPGEPWHFWGPYLAERAWGTVREDYSANGDAWNYFPHDHARSRTYRWNEDGIGGISDHKGRLCFAFAFSLRRTGRPKRRALENRGRIRNLEHERVRGKPLLRHRDRVRQSGRVRHFDPRDRKKLWARTSLAPFATNALVSQHLELGTKPIQTESPQNYQPRARRCDRGGPPLARRLRII